MQGKRTNLFIVTISKIFKYGISQIVFSISLLGMLIIINYVVAVKTSYIDVTKNKINSLSAETQNLLRDIDYPLNINAFYLSGNQQLINLLLELYHKENELITYKLIDPIKNPMIAENYDVSLPGTIVFEAQDRSSLLKPTPKQNSERDISLGIYRFVTEQSRTVYFTTGHGELSISNTEQNGLSLLRDRLLEQNYLVETINLQITPEIPSDCAVLVIVEPAQQSPFTDEEASIISEYQANGGNVCVMLSPGLMPNLDKVMQMQGVVFGLDFVYETSRDRTTEMGPTSPLCTPLDQSEITANLSNQNILFPSARSINVRPADEITIVRLLASSENSWAETDLTSVRTDKPVARDENERKGPVTVAMTTEMYVTVYDTTMMSPPERKLVRSAFYGSGWIISNTFVRQFPGNINVFLNTMNWITRNEEILEITPHSNVFTPIELNTKDRRMISWLSLVIYPGVILIIGFVVWLKKR